MGEVATRLETLTEQLNSFKPASEEQVVGSQRDMSTAVEERLNLQSVRIDTLTDSMHKAQKTADDNAEILHNLLVGIENLSENVKQLKEEMRGWEEPEAQEILDELMQEVPVSSPVADEQFQPPAQPSSVNVSIPPSSVPILFPPASTPSTNDANLSDMQKRVAALRFGQHVSIVEAQGHRKPYPGAPVSIPPSSGMNETANVTESEPVELYPFLFLQ